MIGTVEQFSFERSTVPTYMTWTCRPCGVNHRVRANKNGRLATWCPAIGLAYSAEALK